MLYVQSLVLPLRRQTTDITGAARLHRAVAGLMDGLDEAATRRNRVLLLHELSCSFTPSIPKE